MLFFVVLSSMFVNFNIQSQINLSFDDDCSMRNSALFSDCLLKFFGDSLVNEFFETNTSILFTWEVDQFGRIKKIKYFHMVSKPTSVDSRGNQTIYFTDYPLPLPEDFKNRVKDSLVKYDIRFEICHYKRSRNEVVDQSALIQRYLQKKRFQVGTNFPAEFFWSYYNRAPSEKSMTKLNHYKRQLVLYLPKK